MMGDYTKLIVDASLVGVSEDEVKEKVSELGLSCSAYHCDSVVKHIEDQPIYGRLNVVLVGQTKYARGQQEFLEWLKPFVRQGSGEREIWAFQIYETGKPIIWAINDEYRCGYCGHVESDGHMIGCPINGW